MNVKLWLTEEKQWLRCSFDQWGQRQKARTQHASHYQTTRNNPDYSLTFGVFQSKKHRQCHTFSWRNKRPRLGLLNFHEKTTIEISKFQLKKQWADVVQNVELYSGFKKGVHLAQLKTNNNNKTPQKVPLLEAFSYKHSHPEQDTSCANGTTKPKVLPSLVTHLRII